jgi:hypothetical protein
MTPHGPRLARDLKPRSSARFGRPGQLVPFFVLLLRVAAAPASVGGDREPANLVTLVNDAFKAVVQARSLRRVAFGQLSKRGGPRRPPWRSSKGDRHVNTHAESPTHPREKTERSAVMLDPRLLSYG